VAARDETGPDPRELLPEGYRDRWIVLPRDTPNMVFLVGFLLGAGTATTVIGFAVGPASLRWGFAVSLLLCFLQRFLIPWSEHRIARELREAKKEREGREPR